MSQRSTERIGCSDRTPRARFAPACSRARPARRCSDWASIWRWPGAKAETRRSFRVRSTRRWIFPREETMQIFKRSEVPILRNAGIESEQLVFPESSPEARVTLTRVTVPPGAISPRHSHQASEQVWLVISGESTLLLAGDKDA